MSSRARTVTVDLLANIDVDDLGKAIDFYRDAFGLQVGRRFGEFGVEMLGGSSAIYLLAKQAGTPASSTITQTRDYRRHWTPVHLDFVVPDIEAAVARTAAVGATREGNIQEHNWGKIATLADPFGHGFCLIEFVGLGYDEIADPA